MTTHIIIGFLLAVAVCIIAFFRKWLNLGGAMAAAVIGTVVWAVGGWQAALPLLLFFISSSMLGRIFNNSVAVSDKKDKQPRDAVQVLCNGGAATFCLLFFYISENQLAYWAYWASIAISTSDTWSSVIGNRFAGKVVDVWNGKPISKGLSGGISAAGTLAGFAGSGLIAIIMLLLSPGNSDCEGVLVTGFAGMLIDSLLGSRLQARYRLADGTVAEFDTPGKSAMLEKGWGWLNNDMVNLLANASTIAIALAIFYLMG